MLIEAGGGYDFTSTPADAAVLRAHPGLAP